jgi:hypothetical protein
VGSHVWWFAQSDHQGDVVAGFGGALTVVGILVAAQPYIRKGLIQAAREQVGLHDHEQQRREEGSRQEEAEAESVSHVIKERVVGVLLIGLGSMLNGYGTAIARALALALSDIACH